jgi:hypothetical protein
MQVPEGAEQLSTVHSLLSLQFFGDVTQIPAAQWSPTVQPLPSLQLLLLITVVTWEALLLPGSPLTVPLVTAVSVIEPTTQGFTRTTMANTADAPMAKPRRRRKTPPEGGRAGPARCRRHGDERGRGLAGRVFVRPARTTGYNGLLFVMVTVKVTSSPKHWTGESMFVTAKSALNS